MQQTQTKNERTNGTNEQNCEQDKGNLQSLIIVGKCRGIYIGEVERRFTGNHILVAKHDGTVILHSASKGILPVCYVNRASSLSIDRDLFDAELEVNAKDEEGHRLQVIFRRVYSMSGVPEKRVPNVVRAVLECVAELDGQLGRNRIAGILTGSSSRRVLGMSTERLRSFGRAHGRSKKEIVSVIDELLVQGYLAVLVDNEYPTISITHRGRQVLETGEFNGTGLLAALSTDSWPAFSDREREVVRHLRKWRRDVAKEQGVPPYLVLEDRCLLDLAYKLPGDMEELKLVQGIGRKRAERFGPQLLYLLNWIGATPAKEAGV